MITLGFDSTASVASVAVYDGERVLGEYKIDNGLTQSELLLPMAESLMKSLKLEFSQIELLGVNVGPGSFTGVRIGTALVKGIAFGRNIPCVAVSTLDSLAKNLFPTQGIICPVMDARRNQVYNALYHSDGKATVRLTPDRAISLDALAEELAEFNEPIYLCADGYEIARKALSQKGVPLMQTPAALISQSAASVARLALELYEAGAAVSDKELSPTYLRLPQAERERLERLGQRVDG